MLLSESRDCPIFNREIRDPLKINRVACQSVIGVEIAHAGES